MTTNSKSINRALLIANKDGNTIKEISSGWSKVKQVVHVTHKLTPFVRKEIERDSPGLRYWISEGTPHNAPEEGYISDEDQIAISFPR
jgi:hypothetical protein